MGFENVGKNWKPATLATYLKGIKKPVWCTSITFHHTGVPSLEQRPKGFTQQHLKNLQSYYQTPVKGVKGAWSSGPHLFIDDDEAWGLTGFEHQGTHAKSFNRSSIGIEVLGNYDVETPFSGRGGDVWTTATATGKVLLEWLGLQPSALTVKFHRDDPKTKKSCPGKKVEKAWVLGQIQNAKVS